MRQKTGNKAGGKKMNTKGGVNSSSEEFATVGPFTEIFGNPLARVLDQCLYVGNMEQTISMLAESTNLSYKTVDKAVNRLQKMGLITHTRKIGNAKVYKFQVENHLSDLIEIVQKIQFNRPDE